MSQNPGARRLIWVLACVGFGILWLCLGPGRTLFLVLLAALGLWLGSDMGRVLIARAIAAVRSLLNKGNPS